MTFVFRHCYDILLEAGDRGTMALFQFYFHFSSSAISSKWTKTESNLVYKEPKIENVVLTTCMFAVTYDIFMHVLFLDMLGVY